MLTHILMTVTCMHVLHMHLLRLTSQCSAFIYVVEGGRKSVCLKTTRGYPTKTGLAQLQA